MFFHTLLAFFLMPLVVAQNNANITGIVNSTNVTCELLSVTVVITKVGWFKSGNPKTLKQLANHMLFVGTLDCPEAQSQTNYIVAAKSPQKIIKFNYLEYCQVVSFGLAELCVFTPLAITATSVSNWGVSPVLDKPRGLIFFFTVERFSYDGTGQNGDEMIVDMVVSVACGHILMFSEGNLNGRSVEAEGGKKSMVAATKCRVWLPHTSTIAGYTDPIQDGSSPGLYGLFALIILPVLACAALIGYAWYSWLHTPKEVEVEETAGQQQPQSFTPQMYVPQATVPQQAYFPQAYIPRV